MPCREINDEVAVQDGSTIREHNQSPVRRSRDYIDNPLDIGGAFDRARHQFEREPRSSEGGRSQKIIIGTGLGVGDQGGARQVRRNLLEHRQPFADDALLVEQKAGKISTRSSETLDKAVTDWIGHGIEHDRYCSLSS